MGDVSVVIITCNQDWCLEECLLSVELQLPDMRIIVDDNIRKEGLAGALIRGVNRVTTEYFVPMAADDMLHPMFVQRTMDEIGDAAAAYTNVVYFGNEEKGVRAGNFEGLEDRNNLPGVALFRTETYHEVGGYRLEDEWWCDWGLWLSLKHHGAKVVHVDEDLFYYRRHDHNISSTRPKDEEARLRALIRRNHAT